MPLENCSPAIDGSNFGELIFHDKSVSMKSLVSNQAFEIKLNSVSQCVIPGNNRNEVEIQFQETEGVDDSLVQLRFHFPSLQDDGDTTAAEDFTQTVLNKGVISKVQGNIIAEFSQDQGNFLTPRGRYAIQMYSTFLRMHGAKYDYKIHYEDISKLFLLHKPDGVTAAIVVALEKPIRQGNQKYAHLVLQSHRVEHTLQINLSDEELAERYNNQLSKELTMPMCSLIAKVFKELSQSKVFVPKNYKSDRGDSCVKCSIKANDGLLFPLEKSLIFIHKPTLCIRFEDIESIEFQRYVPSASAATRNFDLLVSLLPSAASTSSEGKELLFNGIDRSEFQQLYHFFESKKLPIKELEEAATASSILEQLGQDAGGDDSESEDEDYEDKGSSDSDNEGSDDSENDAEIVDETSQHKKHRKTKAPNKSDEDESDVEDASSPSKKRKSDATAPQKRAKKDKNAPKKGRSAYIFFIEENRAKLRAENPTADFGTISKLASDLWKNVSAEEKSRFEDMAKNDKERYAQEMSTYAPQASEHTTDSSPKKKRPKKDKNAPKGVSSAYIIFSKSERQKVREANPTMSVPDISREVGARWNAMSSEEKAPFEEKSAEDKIRYQKEMAAYKSSSGAGIEEAIDEVFGEDSVDEEDA